MYALQFVICRHSSTNVTSSFLLRGWWHIATHLDLGSEQVTPLGSVVHGHASKSLDSWIDVCIGMLTVALKFTSGWSEQAAPPSKCITIGAGTPVSTAFPADEALWSMAVSASACSCPGQLRSCQAVLFHLPISCSVAPTLSAVILASFTRTRSSDTRVPISPLSNQRCQTRTVNTGLSHAPLSRDAPCALAAASLSTFSNKQTLNWPCSPARIVRQ